MFRNAAGLIGPFSEVVLRHLWGAGDRAEVVAVFVDPAHVIAARYRLPIGDGSHIGSQVAALVRPLRPGEWRVLLLHGGAVAAETRFIVTPLAVYGGAPVRAASVPALHGGPGDRYTDVADVDALRPHLQLTGSAAAAELAERNARRTGASLRRWIDGLTRGGWALAGACADGHTPACLPAALSRCYDTHWSTHAPDPKSAIGDVNPLTGTLR